MSAVTWKGESLLAANKPSVVVNLASTISMDVGIQSNGLEDLATSSEIGVSALELLTKA
jgi:hypothetical protein